MQEPIRIVHNIASLHLGGSQAFVMNMYRNIDRSKVQFDFVVTPETKEGFYDEITNLGVKYLAVLDIKAQIIFSIINGGMIF